MKSPSEEEASGCPSSSTSAGAPPRQARACWRASPASSWTGAGLDRTGRLITAAALIVASVLGALVTSQISLLKMLGFGLALAVLVDATLVRGLLVPAVMKLTGRASWWAPRPLARFTIRD